MSVKLRFNFATERGNQIADGIRAKQDDLDTHCSCPEQICDVKVKELPESRFQITVTRPRAAVNWDDWSVADQGDRQYSKTFESPTVDEIAASIGELLERPLVERLVVATTEEFLSNLRNVRKQFYWVFESDRGWHVERRSQARLRVRGSAKTGPCQGIGLDPIGALCYALTRTLYERAYWEDAAKALVLPLASASDLLAAAEDRTWQGVEGQRRPNERLRSLRRRLIETVGLKAPSV